MSLICSRALKATLCGLVLTSFVTGCVKNESKNNTTPIQDEIKLNQKALLNTSSSNKNTKVINYSSETLHKNIIQEWTFDISRSTDITINFVKYKNSTCVSSESLIYRFEIQKNQLNANGSYKGKAIPMLTKGYKLTLNSGKYVLRSIVENHGLCKNIDLSFNIKMSNAQQLSYNSNINAHITCNTVSNRGGLKPDHHAQIFTNPMTIDLVANNYNSHTVVLDSRAGYVCEAIKRPDTKQCKESIILNHSVKDAILVSQHQCSMGQTRKTKPSLLSISQESNSISAHFKCAYRRSRRDYRFTDCNINYNLGETLPLTDEHGIPNIGFHIMDRELQVHFTLDRSNIDTSNIPGQVHVNLFDISTNLPIFKHSTQINRAKLLNGEVVLKSETNEISIRKKLSQVNMRNLYLSISNKSNNYTSGIFNYGLRKLCNKHPFLITRQSHNNNDILRGCAL